MRAYHLGYRRRRWLGLASVLLASTILVSTIHVALSQDPLAEASPAFTITHLPAASPVPLVSVTFQSYARGHLPPSFDLNHLDTRAPHWLSSASLPSTSLPATWDWRANGVTTRVQDQGLCGACYAFASLASFESQLLRYGQGAFDFSENNVIECNYERSGCRGGNIWLVTNYLSTHGAVLEPCDPFDPAPQPCNATCPYIKTATGMYALGGTNPSRDALKMWLRTYGPLYVAMDAGQPGSPWETELGRYNGSYTLFHPGYMELNHAVLLVGWNDSLPHAGGAGAWIVKNSWGTRWGGTAGYGSEGGYFTIAYESAGIGAYPALIHDWQNYDPQRTLLYLDEAGPQGAVGWDDILQPWGLVRLIPSQNGCADRVELWTADATTDIDVYVYDAFHGNIATGLLSKRENSAFPYPGYHSILLESPVALTAGRAVYVMVKFGNQQVGAVPIDHRGPVSPNQSYLSRLGQGGPWYDLGTLSTPMDLGIRLRMAPCAVTPTATATATTVVTPSRTPTQWVTGHRINMPVVLKPLPTPTPHPSGWVTIMQETFEGSFPDVWEVIDQGMVSGIYHWGKRNCNAFQGNYSGWAVGGGANGASLACGSPYPNDVDAWMIYGPFSLIDATAADLSYMMWLNAESNYDGLLIMASVDGYHFFGKGWTGQSNGWVSDSLNLTNIPTLGNLLGRSKVWIAFIFMSDHSIRFPEGAYLDNIILRQYIGGTPLADPTPEAGAANTVLQPLTAHKTLDR